MSLLDPAMFEEQYLGLLPYSQADAAEAARAAAMARLGGGVKRPNASTGAWDHAIEDARRTVPGAAVRGVTTLLGSNGDAQVLLGKGARWLGDKLGFSPDQVERALTFARNRVPQFPTSDQIQSQVESYTGEFHKPETRLGKFTDSLGQGGFAGLAGGPFVAGARGLGGAALRYGIFPSLTSEAAGQLTEDTQMEPWARLAGALGGIGVGAMTAPRSAPPAAGLANNSLPPVWSSKSGKDLHVLRDPPAVPPRPIELDYPNGVVSDAEGQYLEKEKGRILLDMEGRPLYAKFIAGHRNTNVPERGLTPKEVEQVATGLTRGHVYDVNPKDLPPGVGSQIVGLNDPRTGARNAYAIAMDRTLSSEQRAKVLAHETGHGVDDFAHHNPRDMLWDVARGIKTKGLEGELKRVYSDMQLVKGLDRVHPKDFDYPRDDWMPEMVAEAIRAYMASPSYMKTFAPKTAAAIREAVNSNSRLSQLIQFNALAGGAAFGLGEMQNQTAQDQSSGGL